MSRILCPLLFITITGTMSALVLTTREEWNARPPVLIEPMTNPVPYVIIHHSYIPPACTTTADCLDAMRKMQDMHQITKGWNDIGYHFAVGGDGHAYEGRGWSRVGAHAPGYNNISIGICVIGDWTQELPPEWQLEAVHQLVEHGVEQGMIQEDYKLLGHRQVRDTECPGDRLFNEITTWEHFSETPKSTKENRKESGNASGVDDNKLFFFKHKS
ncbi:peptidoglycan-recognition protein LB-like isoform X2 [Tenebrio molitor]|uniref:peptidoglycan-recognition protein LB-like isoform X2 n=1 Tax=Tenebrio molitor TaxID=7067 RepID=UPI00362483A8